MFIFSVLFFLVMTLGAMWLGGGVDMFIDIPSLIIIFPPAIVFTIAATSWQDMLRAVSIVISSQTGLANQEYKKSQQVFNVMGNSAILLGFFMTLIGAIAMGSNIKPENFSTTFGPAFAVCILTLLFGLGLKLVCYVAQQKLFSLAHE